MRIFNTVLGWLRHLRVKYITKARQTPVILGTREEKPGKGVIKPTIISAKDLTIGNVSTGVGETPEATAAPGRITNCPYCQGKDIVRRGWRKKKYEKAQLYFCNQCQKTFTG